MRSITLIKIVALVLAIQVQLVTAQENRGVSWILQMCSARSDCGAISSAYKNASVLNAGWMYLTSNPDGCQCSRKFLSDPRPKRVRLDLCNSTCFPERGRRCEPQECFAGMRQGDASAAVLKNDPATYRRIDRAINLAKADIAAATPPLTVAIKACLECSLTTEARKKLNEYAKQKFPESQFPGIKFVDNPLTGGCLPGYLCERHGSPKGGDNLISDNDGLDYDGIDQWQYWKQNAKSFMVLAWKGCNNGLKKGEGYKPGVQRTDYCGASRDGVDFASATQTNAIEINSALDPQDTKGCKRMVEAPDGKVNFVLKLGEGRSYGVFLPPSRLSVQRFNTVQLRKNGRVIDESKPGGFYRFGEPYDHDTMRPKRRVYDFRRHPNSYPDNSVLFADGVCWVLKKPRFRVD